MRLTPDLPHTQVGSGKVVKVTGVAGRGRTATLLLRGSNKLVLEEAERSVHDALCVLRCLVHRRALVPGGAAPEMEVEHALAHWAKTLMARTATPCTALQRMHLARFALIRWSRGTGIRAGAAAF